jgi:hypothetical protein
MVKTTVIWVDFGAAAAPRPPGAPRPTGSATGGKARRVVPTIAGASPEPGGAEERDPARRAQIVARRGQLELRTLEGKLLRSVIYPVGSRVQKERARYLLLKEAMGLGLLVDERTADNSDASAG